MLQTTERPAPSGKRGLFRRLLVRGERPATEDSDGAGTGFGPPALIDLRDDLPSTQWRVAVSERLERLETGMALVAQTMKRAFAQVYGSIDELRGGAAANSDLQRILDESVVTLKASVEELADAIHRVPFILAAAADDINAKLEAAQLDAGHDTPGSSPGLIRDSRTQPDLLPATPFDLEPVEDQFPPMDDESDEFEARKIWQMEA